MSNLVVMLRAVGDPTRLRLLLLLRQAELTVSELIDIVGQSQPRISRHLKLLCEAGLLERFKEGSWVFHHAVEEGPGGALGTVLADLSGDDEQHAMDMQRLTRVRETRARQASAYFKANAGEWNRIRALHAPEGDVEEALLARLRSGKVDTLLDAGTGTGRMLELAAPLVQRAVGIDASPEMLAIARDRLSDARFSHIRVRLGDVYRLPPAVGEGNEGFDVVLFHQVLHYLDDPGLAVREAARVLKPGGRILLADFAPHDLEFLREEFAHRRLGFTDKEVAGWFSAAHLKIKDTVAVAPDIATPQKLTVKIWTAESPLKAKA